MARYIFEVVELTATCELGNAGERAVVTDLDDLNMTLVFTGDSIPVAGRVRMSARLVKTDPRFPYLRHVCTGE